MKQEPHFGGYGSKQHPTKEERNKNKGTYFDQSWSGYTNPYTPFQMELYFPGLSCNVLISLPLTIGFDFLTVQLTDKREVRSENCNLRASLVSSWKRTNCLLLKQAQGFPRSRHEQLGFQSRGRSGWRDFPGEEVACAGSFSTVWGFCSLAIFTRKQDPFCECFRG